MTAFVMLMLLVVEPTLTLCTSDDMPPEAAAEPVAKCLDAKGLRLATGDETAMTFWLRSAIPATATAAQIRNGLTYREVPEGSLVGVVTFSKPFTDYRKQEIAAGSYTLRLGFQPEVGDHAGTAPHAEFLMLAPVADDTTSDPLDAKTLLKLSAKATGGDHPAVMLLYPHAPKDAEPKLAAKPDGVRVLTFTRKVTTDDGPATLGFAVAVQGHSKSR